MIELTALIIAFNAFVIFFVIIRQHHADQIQLLKDLLRDTDEQVRRLFKDNLIVEDKIDLVQKQLKNSDVEAALTARMEEAVALAKEVQAIKVRLGEIALKQTYEQQFNASAQSPWSASQPG